MSTLGIAAAVVADSWNPEQHSRLTTMKLVYPRFIHAEFMTHRMFSRNASSSRAIPVKTMLARVRLCPAQPAEWGRNKPGMQADTQPLEAATIEAAQTIWDESALMMADQAERMSKLNVHKQVVNRLLEPFQMIHVVVTATEWDNFFALRRHPDADPTMQRLAEAMYEAIEESVPQVQEVHLPFLTEHDKSIGDEHARIAVSIARCARVSYMKHDGSMATPAEDMVLYQRLVDSQHLSPLEHVAFPMRKGNDEKWCRGITHVDTHDQWWSGNFRGWVQYRHWLLDKPHVS